MFGHRFFGKAYFSPHYFGPADQTAAGIQILNYGVMRRHREEYERRERESRQEIAQDIAASIDEGLPEPLRPERPSPETNTPDFAPLPPAPSHEAVAARVAAEIEARLRAEIPAPAEIAAIEDDYDDDEVAILTLLLAPLVPVANDDDEEALLALLLAA